MGRSLLRPLWFVYSLFSIGKYQLPEPRLGFPDHLIIYTAESFLFFCLRPKRVRVLTSPPADLTHGAAVQPRPGLHGLSHVAV